MTSLFSIQIFHAISKAKKKNKTNRTKQKQKKLISVSKLLTFGATWINDKSKFKTTFNEVSLKLAINFLLDNFF